MIMLLHMLISGLLASIGYKILHAQQGALNEGNLPASNPYDVNNPSFEQRNQKLHDPVAMMDLGRCHHSDNKYVKPKMRNPNLFSIVSIV